ncbi:hypothetical protein SteCoe_27009 [Stentor coeruleus]|uniref:Uncharacterized protein n=1 Tax=Stentor coeruleus TaxID=5963 RepID=A0A1R2BBE4_9CILI|nr:hypothetical protein SteCoe_27009 [Stentor coeruleus]
MLEESNILEEESKKVILESNSENLSEKDMKEYIISHFENIKKKISPERRMLIFKQLNSHIKERYFFIKSLVKDYFSCEIHASNKATFVSKENFQLICDQCAGNYSKVISISDDNLF